MGLDGNVLGGEVVTSNDDLVYIVLRLGNGLGFEQRFDCDFFFASEKRGTYQRLGKIG